MKFRCYNIQYHQDWTKFYFMSQEGNIALTLSFPERRSSRYAIDKWLYEFILPAGDTKPVLGLAGVNDKFHG